MLETTNYDINFGRVYPFSRSEIKQIVLKNLTETNIFIKGLVLPEFYYGRTNYNQSFSNELSNFIVPGGKEKIIEFYFNTESLREHMRKNIVKFYTLTDEFAFLVNFYKSVTLEVVNAWNEGTLKLVKIKSNYTGNNEIADKLYLYNSSLSTVTVQLNILSQNFYFLDDDYVKKQHEIVNIEPNEYVSVGNRGSSITINGEEIISFS